jgi:plasmid stability protein
MTQIILEDLDPAIAQQLEALAQQHGRTLQEEAKVLLTDAVVAATKPKLTEEEKIERGILLMEKQMRDHARKMGQPVEPERPITEEDRVKIRETLEQLKQLKQLGISLGGLSIREAREEGRRY